eukprot:TRINITY_DN1405_c0_g1_i1.p2 TRINITY_DN1405_c0_g1~~TRINITY_DN1405_c0_g1_i1.p2  ORF type:complete len:106 (+),score=25.23 TRINITY_DN1405_c0_g1_i1:613-930(+)
MTQRLDNLLEEQSLLQQELEKIERQIFALETSYIESTESFGNIINGWDIHAINSKAVTMKQSRKRKVKNEDRIFSASSSTGFINNFVDDDPEMKNNRPLKKRRRK